MTPESAEPPSFPARNRAARAVFYAVAGVCWLVIVLMALEVAERARIGWLAQAKNALNNQQIARMRDAWRALPPLETRPDWIEHRPPREGPGALAEVPERARAGFLRNLSCIAAVVDPEGGVRDLSPTPPPAHVGALHEALSAEEGFAPLLEPYLMEEVRQGIADAQGGNTTPPNHYEVRLGEGASDMYMLQVQPWPEPERAVVVAWQSIWREWMFALSPHVYVNDMYGREELWTNARGYRDDEIAAPKPEGVFRVLCIGGSTTLEGIRNDQTYPNLLEARLRERFGTPLIEVVNLGVYGLNSAGESARLEEYLALEPDFIVHYNFINDLSPIVDRALSESGDPRVRLWPLLRHWTFAHHYWNRWFMPAAATWRHWMDETTFRHRRRLVEVTGEHEIPMALASFAYPDLANATMVEYEKFRDMSIWLFDRSYVSAETYVWLCELYNQRMRVLAEAHEHVTYLPVAEQLTGAGETFLDICHLTHEGIVRKAEIMVEELLPALGQARATPRRPIPGT